MTKNLKFNLEKKYSENARKIYERLYLVRDTEGNFTEDIEECHERVSNFLAKSLEEKVEFKRLLDEQKFRPNTPCMANAGVKPNPMLLACFVLGLEDSMDSIIEMWGTCAKVYEGGGGTGIPITNLRRKGAALSSGGEASGPLSYLDVVESVSNTVKSGGKARRAANLIAAEYTHPDIVDIINCKRNQQSYKSMNLSVAVDNEFMKIVNHYQNSDHISNTVTIDLIDPKEKKTGIISAQGLWNHIIRAAWETGDPGLLFLDRVNQDNPLIEEYGKIQTTNPCGEVGLWAWSACCLGHMNLTKYLYHDDYDLLMNKTFKWPEFRQDIYRAVLFLNRIIEKTSYPNPKFKEMMMKTRPIGLGMMGFADLLYKLKIRYGSDKSIGWLDKLTCDLTNIAFKSSSKLVQENKIPSLDINEKSIENFRKYLEKFGVSSSVFPGNITVTCLAPTGSTAISADCSFAFEPHFALTWTKHLSGGGTLTFLNDEFKKELEKLEMDTHEEGYINKKIQKHKGSIQSDAFKLPKKIKEVFVTAHDIPIRERIEMQAAAQKNITMAVSSTVNLSNSATKEDIAEVYLLAWKKGLKGITVFRDGCLNEQPVDFGTDEKNEKNQDHYLKEADKILKTSPRKSEDDCIAEEVWKKENKKQLNEWKKETKKSVKESLNKLKEERKPKFGKYYKRPQERIGKVVEVATPIGKLYVRGSFDENDLMEVFIDVGSQGSRENVLLNGLGRVISRALQRNVDLNDITDTLRGAGGDIFRIKFNDNEERSIQVEGILDAVATILDHKFNIKAQKEYNKQAEKLVEKIEGENELLDRCPECRKFTLRRDSGCKSGMCVDPECGFSNCS